MRVNNLKLQRATIYGFGRWVDETIDFSGHSYICIYGENESGKSTLQQFLLFMLFGLPPKQRTFYQPKSSGKLGGRLTVIDDNGKKFTIERLDQVRNGAAKCYTQAGEEHDETWLKEKLKGMTKTIYESIFSFSGADLSNITKMKEDDLGEVLLGIGLTGSNNIYSIEKRLDSKMGDLFKRYGKKPVINQQLKTLEELFSDLKKHEAREDTYKEKKTDIQVIKNEISSLQSSIHQAKEDRFTLEKQQQALPLIKKYHYYLSELSNYPSQIAFPEDGIERLNQLKEQLLPLKSELSVVEDNQRKYKERREELQQKLHEEAVYKQAQEIIEGEQSYLENRREIEKIRVTVKQLETQMKKELEELDLGLDPGDLSNITFPFQIEKTWNDIKNNRDQLNAEQDQIDQEAEYLKKQQNELESLREEEEACVLADQQRNECVHKLNRYNEQDYMRSFQAAKSNQQLKWEKAKKQKEKRISNLFLASVVAAVLIALLASITDDSLLFTGTVILLLLGGGQYFLGKRSLHVTDQFLDTNEEVISSSTITKEEKENIEHLLAEDKQRREKLEVTLQQLKALHVQLMKWEEKKFALQTKEKQLLVRMEEQYKHYPFLEKISVSYWPEFYHAMKNLLSQNRKKVEYEALYQKLNEYQIEFENKCRIFLQDISGESVNDAMEFQLKIIRKSLEDRENAKNVLRQYENWSIDNAEQQRVLKQKVETYEREIRNLYDTANVNSEDDFLKKAKQVEKKKEITEKINQFVSQLSIIFPDGDQNTFINGKGINEQTLQGKYEQNKEVIDELEKEIEAKRHQLASVHSDISNLEMSEAYSNIMHRFHRESEHLKKLANEWAVLQTAKGILTETKRSYRKKYLDKVINRTSTFFAVLTNHRYIKVYPPLENTFFQVEASDEIRYNVNELSKGTIDQLYISLRLAISEIMSNKHCLPFIIDDAFVQFDSIRTMRVMEILADQAKHQQIILFTCKSDILQAAQKAKIIRLGNPIRI